MQYTRQNLSIYGKICKQLLASFNEMMPLWPWNKDSCNFDRNQQVIIKLVCSVLILYQYSYIGYIPGCLQQIMIL